MLVAKLLCISVVVIILAGEVGQAVAQTAPAPPMCQIEETNLAMVERERKTLERQVATLALQLRVATTRLSKIEQELTAAKKPAAATEKPVAPVPLPAE